MHKDQKRVKDVLLPQIMDRVLGESREAERDCTILNRALIQGPDPLYLMETCPQEFASLCGHLDLDVEVGKDAIGKAHVQGPGILLLDTGLPSTAEALPVQVPVQWKREALWLLLASMSDCTEQGYGAEVPLRERLARCQQASIRLATRFEAGISPSPESLTTALRMAAEFMSYTTENTVFTLDARGFPHTSADIGFYVAYKRGHKVCAVSAGDKVFWGTTPDTTLVAQNITVDINISPCFGFVWNR